MMRMLFLATALAVALVLTSNVNAGTPWWSHTYHGDVGTGNEVVGSRERRRDQQRGKGGEQRTAHRDQPLTAPADSPDTSQRWVNMNSTVSGKPARIAVAAKSPQR